MSEIVDCKLKYQTEKGKRLKAPVRLEYADGRIIFRKSPFGMKDEIKAMAGAKWHGFDKKPKKYWSVADNFRNQFQLNYMMGHNVYEWFEKPLVETSYREYFRKGVLSPPMPHQFDMANHGLSHHFQIWGAEMGTGKTLSAQMVIENANVPFWYWVGPKTSLPNIQREFNMWGFDETIATIEYMTYERLVRIMDEWQEGNPLPGGVIFDESSRCKTYSSQRSMAAQKLADLMRSQYMWDAYVILMSGTPSPKRPTDWWSQCEIAWPGFLKEGSAKALEKRLAFQVQKTFDSGTFWTTVGWRDDETKCRECGLSYDEGDHERDVADLESEIHKFVPSKNEVAYMFKRLDGLALIKHKKDCLTLPEKRYRKVECKPTSSLLRVAKTVVDSAPNAMTGMTKLRELSDGFQYRDIVDGTKPCNHCPDACGEVDEWFDTEDEFKCFEAIDMLDEELVARLEKRTVTCPKCNGSGEIKKIKRITKTVPCPKEKALRGLLGECEETGRIVIFAGFTGSVDRCVEVCHNEGWAVVRCDGRGFQVTDADGTTHTDVDPLDFWADMGNKSVAFVAHPESGGMSLTLVEARMAVYWSNSFKPEYRVQSEDRIHRKGMDENLGCVIVDLIHLPTDERVVDIIRENRKLELMTMGMITDGINWEEAA